MKPLSPCDGSHPENAASDRATEIARPPADTGEPDHYNCLEAVKREAFALLSRGASDRRSAFYTPVLVTNGLDGFPAARTVVLRGFDPNLRTITIHSDYRSGKVAEITGNDRAAAVFYDPRKKIQIRVTGHCQIHHQNDATIDAWRKLPVFSRRCYLAQPPGSVAEEPSSGLPPELEKRAPTLEDSGQGFSNFVVIRFQIVALEWLYLSARGHRRAKITWPGDAAEEAFWLFP